MTTRLIYARILQDVFVGGIHGKWLRQGDVVQVSKGPDELGDVETWSGLYLAAGDYEPCDLPGWRHEERVA